MSETHEQRGASICAGFLRSWATFPNRPALEVKGCALTYAELHDRAASIAATFDHDAPPESPPLTAVFAHRSIVAYAGVLAALLHGDGYVPLNRTFPIERTRTMLERSRCRRLIVDEESAAQLDAVLATAPAGMIVVLPERDDVAELANRWPQHRFKSQRDLLPARPRGAPAVGRDAIAYLLFTSGSTGTPKGVAVAHRNVDAYVSFMSRRLSIDCHDRFSQMFDLTFDLSAADMFVAWACGACVCCAPEKAVINPGKYIAESRLNIWFSVPSTAVFMKKLGALKPGMYPTLRISLFCGEALPVDVANTWAAAAPNSVVENIYGPTELTIACTYYRWNSQQSPAESAQGIAPIGHPFPGMVTLVADDSLHEVPAGAEGELLMTGPQLSLGYWHDPQKTAAAFVTPPGKSERYYRTGDRVRRPLDGGPLLYLGRMDNQIKVLGHRVELGEVEAVIREESAIDGVVAIGWPKTAGGAGGIEVFLETDRTLAPDLTARIARRLPAYMTPRQFHCIPKFPLNPNGKTDRRALTLALDG